jgi:hypothetical protein
LQDITETAKSGGAEPIFQDGQLEFQDKLDFLELVNAASTRWDFLSRAIFSAQVDWITRSKKQAGHIIVDCTWGGHNRYMPRGAAPWAGG